MCAHRKRSGRLSVMGLFLLLLVLLVGMVIGAGLHAIYPVVCTTSACPKICTASDCPVGYTASALIRVAMSQDSIVYKKNRTNIQDFAVFKNTQLALIKSPHVLMAALRLPKIANLEIVKQEADPLSWLGKKLKVGYVNDSEIMRVSLTAKEPKEVAELVNAVVDAYIEEVVEKKEQKRREMFAQLTQIYNSKENEVRSKRASLINLAEQLSASHSEAVQTQSTVNIQELYALRGALLRMQMDLGKAKGALQAGQAKLERLDDAPVSEIEFEKLVGADPVCKMTSEMIAKLRGAVGEKKQMTRPGDKKAAVDRLAKQLETAEQEYQIRENELRELIKATKRAETEEEVAATQVQVTILTKQVKDMSAKVEAQREKVSEIGKSSVDIEMMSTELDSLKKNLAQISAKRAMLDIESRARPRITRVSEAYLESK